MASTGEHILKPDPSTSMHNTNYKVQLIHRCSLT
jgi:hypothetical protein